MAKRRNIDDGWSNDGPHDGFDDIDPDDDSVDREVDGSDVAETDLDEADQKRFGSNIAYCPECGAEVLDDADLCPKCFTWIDGATHSRPSRLKRSFRAVVVTLLIAAAVIGCFGCWLVLR